MWVQPTEFNVRINAQLTPDRSPTSEPFSYCDRARIGANHNTLSLRGVTQDHFQIRANTAIHRLGICAKGLHLVGGIHMRCAAGGY